MRGKRLRDLFLNAKTRITPAHAGKTTMEKAEFTAPSDHPRACGENWHTMLHDIATSGSPPRMRGKHDRRDKEERTLRITPAHAGKTQAHTCNTFRRSDHPRACGENASTNAKVLILHGSPPRMRGKLTTGSALSLIRRITPAHAGKTPCQVVARRPLTDHPRACGENRVNGLNRLRDDGSPPRMRGKPSIKALPSVLKRITPAHAGKTLCGSGNAGGLSDHPRACGENKN